MKIQVSKFQEGGAAPAPDASAQGGAPDQAQGQDPIMQIAQMFAQGLQNQDCAALSQGAQMFLQLIQQQQGGAPAPQQPAGQEGTAPVFKKGGVLVKRVPKDEKKVPAFLKGKDSPADSVENAKKGGKMSTKKC